MLGWLLTLTALAGSDAKADAELACDLVQWELATSIGALEEVRLSPPTRERMHARITELKGLLAEASCPEITLPDACVQRGLLAAREHSIASRVAPPPTPGGFTFRSFDDRMAAEALDHGVQWTTMAPPDPPLDTSEHLNSWEVIEDKALMVVFGKQDRLQGLREFQHRRCDSRCGARPGCEGHAELPALRGLHAELSEAMDFNELWELWELEEQLVDSGASDALAARLASELRVALYTSDAYPAEAWRRLTRVLERLDRPSVWSREEQALAEAWLGFGAAWRDREHLRQARGVEVAKLSMKAWVSTGAKEGSAEEGAVRAALAALVEGSVPAPPETCAKGSCGYDAPARALPAPPAPPWRSPPLPRPRLRHLQADTCAPIREVRVGAVGRDSYGYARRPVVSPTVPGGALRVLMPVAEGQWRLVDVGPDGTVHARPRVLQFEAEPFHLEVIGAHTLVWGYEVSPGAATKTVVRLDAAGAKLSRTKLPEGLTNTWILGWVGGPGGEIRVVLFDEDRPDGIDLVIYGSGAADAAPRVAHMDFPIELGADFRGKVPEPDLVQTDGRGDAWGVLFFPGLATLAITGDGGVEALPHRADPGSVDCSAPVYDGLGYVATFDEDRPMRIPIFDGALEPGVGPAVPVCMGRDEDESGEWVVFRVDVAGRRMEPRLDAVFDLPDPGWWSGQVAYGLEVREADEPSPDDAYVLHLLDCRAQQDPWTPLVERPVSADEEEAEPQPKRVKRKRRRRRK